MRGGSGKTGIQIVGCVRCKSRKFRIGLPGAIVQPVFRTGDRLQRHAGVCQRGDNRRGRGGLRWFSVSQQAQGDAGLNTCYIIFYDIPVPIMTLHSRTDRINCVKNIGYAPRAAVKRTIQ